ncbi:SUMF1/EgtB/PvdO family nonheme iron enzyme [Crocinitomix sp.]|nr:SUMF1/EgtB/PvdO family nonheme iron enzyme [Crocinitomix sp.]
MEEAAIASFFMYDREVTNINYREFLSYYKIKDPEIYKTLLPDTAVWRKSFSYNDPYVKHYFRHPAYNEFPVLGISYHQAQLYCEWLTELYHQNPERDYKKVIYRLPTEAEWIYVANGGNEAAIYPWEGSYMRASNGDIKANCLNFGSEVVYRDTLYKKDDNGLFQEIAIYRAGRHNLMGAAESLNDGADITAPSKSYWPNAFGLYNMAGNACEMVAEVGITHGGSWNDPEYYSQNHVRQFYTGEDSASSKRGFRFVMEVIEY